MTRTYAASLVDSVVTGSHNSDVYDEAGRDLVLFVGSDGFSQHQADGSACTGTRWKALMP